MRIVLVDDEPSVLRILKRHLEAGEHDVLAFSDGGAALDWLCQNTAELLIIDEIMTGMTGTEVIQTLKALRPNEPMRFMLMSGYPEEGFSRNADFFLQKPFSPDTLNATLLRLIARADCEVGIQTERNTA